MKDTSRDRSGRGEAGFTLVEALIAVVVLIFGLMAVTNLMLVAASSNTVANQGTAAVNTAARVMDMVKSNTYASFGEIGTAWEARPAGGPSCGDPALMNLAASHCTDDIPGVGSIHAHWWITRDATDARVYYVRVRAEGLGALAGARSRAEFTTFRSCTNLAGGCPEASATPAPSPTP